MEIRHESAGAHENEHMRNESYIDEHATGCAESHDGPGFHRVKWDIRETQEAGLVFRVYERGRERAKSH